MARVAGAIVGVLALLFAEPTRAQTSCAALTHDVPATRIQALKRGFNLAGQLDRLDSAPINATLLRALRNRGMTNIRLPVPAESVMARFSSERDIARQLVNLNRTTADLIALDYSVTIDLHPGEQFQQLHKNDSTQALSALRDAWDRLARVAGRFSPERVFVELLNEPEVPPGQWQNETELLARFIRERLPDNTLIIGPTYWQRADSLPNLRPLDDLNVVYAIHFYDPMVFTHQGHWDEKNPLSNINGLPFPIRRDDRSVQDIRAGLVAERKSVALKELDTAIAASEAGDVLTRELAPAIQWQRQHRRPLIVNEFGVLKHSAPRESRIAWLTSVAQFSERHCWGWAHWEFAHGFGLLNDAHQLDDELINALLDRK